MKKILFLLVLSLLLNCKNDDDSNNPQDDLATLVVGQWSFTTTADCDLGWELNDNGIFSWGGIDDCNNACTGTSANHSGTYSILGNNLIIDSGLTFINCEVAVEENKLLIFFEEDDVIFGINSEQTSPLILEGLICGN